MDIEKELQKQLIAERDSDVFRTSYEREIDFYSIISRGDIEALQNRLHASADRRGVLSDNNIANARYHAVIMIALVSRFCIEAGMDVLVSYSLSDIYIRMIDKARTEQEISDISVECAFDYYRRMHESMKKSVISRHVVLALEYIRSHIHENLTVENLASALSLNASYLSKLFKQEMGITVSRYIREQKISVATNMLRHLDDSSLNIANYLGFSSQSHFIQVFKKETGSTPEEYRRRYYHQSWIGDKDKEHSQD